MEKSTNKMFAGAVNRTYQTYFKTPSKKGSQFLISTCNWHAEPVANAGEVPPARHTENEQYLIGKTF